MYGYNADLKTIDAREAKVIRELSKQILRGESPELLARVEVTFIHSRNVLAGCFMFAIVRSDANAQLAARAIRAITG